MSSDAPALGTGSSGVLLTSRLRGGLPTPLARALELESSPVATRAQRVNHRVQVLRYTLRFLVAVQDAERAQLGLPRPKDLDLLCERMHKPTLGLWSRAAVSLAQTLGRASHRHLPDVGGWLRDGRAHRESREAAMVLLGIRHGIAHSDHLGALPEPRARELLDDSQEPYRRLLQVLEQTCALHLVVEFDGHEADDEAWHARVALFRGTTPTVHELRLDRQALPGKQPVLIAEDGTILRLRPWLSYDPGQGRPATLILDRWTDGAPEYTEPDRGTLRSPLNKPGKQGRPVSPEDWLGGFEDRGLRTIPAALLSQLDDSVLEERPPQVRNCRPIRLLGRGGTGAVWLVADGDRQGARLALKVLHPSLASHREHMERLRREFDSLQKVQVRGVVQVLDFFPDDAQNLYLLMAWVEGDNLAQVVREGPMGTERAARIVGRLLGILSVVHQRGIVHRDIKPSNIIIKGDQPTLIDFGIARTADGRTLTRTVEVVGTPAYSAPEQLQGCPAAVTADIYGMGRVLQDMLLGSRHREVSQVELPDGYQRVLRRAMRPDPAHRFQTAGEMAEALEVARLGGGGGCILGVGDRLYGDLRVVEQGAEVAPQLFVLFAESRLGEPTAALAPGPAGSARAAFHERLADLDPNLRNAHRCVGVRTTDDGIPFLELPADNAVARARALLQGDYPDELPPPPPPAEAKAEPEAPDRGSETVLLALGAMAAGAVAAHSLGNVARRAQGSESTAGRTTRAGGGGAAPKSSKGGLAAGIGALLGAFSSSSSKSLRPVAKTPWERTHHLALLLLGFEARVGGMEVSEAQWRQAWGVGLGGLLVLLRDLEAGAGPVARALADRSDLALIEEQAKGLARTKGPGTPRQAESLRRLGVALIATLQLAAPGLDAAEKQGPLLARVRGQRFEVRCAHRREGWQTVWLPGADV